MNLLTTGKFTFFVNNHLHYFTNKGLYVQIQSTLVTPIWRIFWSIRENFVKLSCIGTALKLRNVTAMPKFCYKSSVKSTFSNELCHKLICRKKNWCDNEFIVYPHNTEWKLWKFTLALFFGKTFRKVTFYYRNFE